MAQEISMDIAHFPVVLVHRGGKLVAQIYTRDSEKMEQDLKPFLSNILNMN